MRVESLSVVSFRLDKVPEVPATRTPASPETIMTALAAEAPDLSRHQLALLTAHVSIETGKGQHLVQHNIGNLIVPGSKEALFTYWRPPWFLPPGPDASERIKRLHAGMLDGVQPRAFRAFPSLNAGVRRYLSRMRGRFAPMLRAGSPEEFVKEWRNTGYTPDLNVERTLPGFSNLYRGFAGPDTAGTASPLGPIALLGGSVLLWVLTRRMSGNRS